MKRLVMALTFALALGTGSLFAQDTPKAEVFGGGSVMNIDTTGYKLTPFGWHGSVNGNVHKSVGIVGEISGNYRKGDKFHTYLGGVQFTHRVEKTSVFAQIKAGGATIDAGGTSDTNLMLGFGGGVDWNINEQVAFRVFQIDWLPLKDGSTWIKNITRGSIGFVWKSAAR